MSEDAIQRLAAALFKLADANGVVIAPSIPWLCQVAKMSTLDTLAGLCELQSRLLIRATDLDGRRVYRLQVARVKVLIGADQAESP